MDPKENKKLYALIEQRSAIITDLPLGFHPAPETRGPVAQCKNVTLGGIVTQRKM